MFTIEQAKISWQGGVPFSADYQDVYFSKAGGLAETQSVFLAGNDLPRRWQGKESFTIAETGFGTGLNFLVTLDQWVQSAPKDARLSYISIEKSPLELPDLERALLAWPELEAHRQALIEAYPECVPGFHRRWLLEGKVCLTLIFADIEQALAALTPAIVDAWYLDGFAPSRNQAMWNESVFTQLARLSREGATFSTFTAASAVRRGLLAAGFEVEKKPGFAGKRERLQGCLKNKAATVTKLPWYSYGKSYAAKTRQAVVVGGGISGVSVANVLANRGWQVRLLEQHSQLANEASGNLAGVVMPRLDADRGRSSQFFLSAFLYTIRWLDGLKQLSGNELPWFKTGVLSLCAEHKAKSLCEWGLPQTVLQRVEAEEAQRLCGKPVSQSGIYFPQAGYLDPVALINFIVQSHSALDVRKGIFVDRLKRIDNMWRVCCSDGQELNTETLVLANGYDAMRLLDSDYLFLSDVRGQLSYLQATDMEPELNMPVLKDGYMIPLYKGKYCIGATYHHGDRHSKLRNEDHNRNIGPFRSWLRDGCDADENIEGRVAWRTTTRDHMPYIGSAPDAAFYAQQYGDIKYGRPSHKYPPAQYMDGLWLLTGMGSRGLVSAPYSAELLADMMEGQALCAPDLICNSLHPARQIIRKLKKKA